MPPLIKLPTTEDLKHLGEFEIAIAAAKVSGDKPWIEKVKKARAEYDKSITSVMVMEDRASRATRSCSSEGATTCRIPAKKLEPGVPSCLPPLPSGASAQPAGPGAVAGVAREPADGPRRRQPDLAAPFRHGAGQDGRELRHPGRAAVAPRAARLAGERAGPHRLGLEGAAPADRHQRDLPAGVELRSRPWWRATRKTGCWHGDRGFGSRPKWCATMPWRSPARWSDADRRPVDQAVPAGRPVGRAGRRRGRRALCARQGGRALRPQPLCLPQAHRPAPGHGHFRRSQPRDLPGQATAHQHAPPGPRALERRDLRRGRPATGTARPGTGGLQPRGADHASRFAGPWRGCRRPASWMS